MIWLRLTQLTISLTVVGAFILLVFFIRAWVWLVGVAAVTGLAVLAGFRTVDKLSLFQPDVIPAITAKIFPFVWRKVKSCSCSVDTSLDYQLENELAKFVNCIIQNCVESWYSHISECPSPVSDARVLINKVTELLVCRLSSVDRCRFLCRILKLYGQHLNCCDSDNAGHYFLTSFAHLPNISASEGQVSDVSCPDAVRYLHTVVFLITSRLLDEHYVNCVLGKEILAQIITREVLLKVMDIASGPEWLYNVVADILTDSSNENLRTVTGGVCASVSAKNSVDLEDSSLGCSSNVVDDSALYEMHITAINSADLTSTSGNTVTTEQASLQNSTQFPNLGDAVFGSHDEDSLTTASSDDFNTNEHHATCLPDQAENVTAVASDCVSSFNVSGFSQQADCKDVRLTRSNSDFCLTSEPRKCVTSVEGNGYEQQLDIDVIASPGLLSDNSSTSKNSLGSVCKKWPSLGCLLASFEARDEKPKRVRPQSASSVVYQTPRCAEDQTREDTDAKADQSTCVPSHEAVFIKMKTLCSSDKQRHVKPHVSDSGSTSALVPSPESDTPAGFLSRRFSHFVRRFSLSSLRVPQFISPSSALPFLEDGSASIPGFESGTDAEVSAAEAKEDFALDHRPQFLFDNICISETESDVPVTKPYTVYVISVRII